MDVPFLDLKSQHAPLKDAILGLWEEVLDTASFIGGNHVLKLEEEFARACGAQYSIALNSGTDALRFIFIALGLAPGDEVITVPNTFIATTESISQAGGKVVFVDIGPGTYNIDPSKIEAAITPKTKGIVPVHLYGQCADMDRIKDIASKHGIWVAEDACQAHLAEYKGKKAGTFGKAAAFSFYPGKNMGACGDAGAVTTDDPEIAEKIRMLRDHGRTKKYYHRTEGYNGRCDALQAAALRVKLKYLPGWNEKRRKNASIYLDLLKSEKGITLPEINKDGLHVFHLFVILVNDRDSVADALKKKGVSTGLHYPVPLHLQEAYKHMNMGKGCFPVAERCAKRLLSLPMYPELTEGQIRYVCDSLKEILNGN